MKFVPPKKKRVSKESLLRGARYGILAFAIVSLVGVFILGFAAIPLAVTIGVFVAYLVIKSNDSVIW